MLQVTNSEIPLAPAVDAPADSDTNGLTIGSPVARALYEVMSGTRVTVVNSPPGAGKTTLVVEMVARLHAYDENMKILVAAPTNLGGASLLVKLHARLDGARIGGSKKIVELAGVGIATAGCAVSVKTVASVKLQSSADMVDVVVFDEAYQTSLADVVQAAAFARQVVMVGDPGQIGPVVTADTSPWDYLGSLGPASPAPHYFASRPDAAQLAMPCTYRLGAATVAVIAPLYPFTFNSERPDCALMGDGGEPLGEVERIEVTDPDAPHDLDVMGRVALRAVKLAKSTMRVADGTTQALSGKDVAVVVSHNSQVTAVRSHVAEYARAHAVDGEITIGTADSLQGGQWLAVVAVDPLIGHAVASPHSRSNGRLCVMLSRHIAHLTWVHSDTWQASLMHEDVPVGERQLAVKVRRALMRKPEVS